MIYFESGEMKWEQNFLDGKQYGKELDYLKSGKIQQIDYYLADD